VAENVALGVPRDLIDDQAVWLSLAAAQLDDFVRGLPGGIYSGIGQQNDALSGGQVQRLGLARALYVRPRLLVLDEATSALDAETEAGIGETLGRFGAETTVVVIAHRLSTIQYSDNVFYMEDGELVASGTFSKLRQSVPRVERYVRLMSFDDD
jgi:ABC-type multidrug transport system fused ATPase/permease subunit